MRHVVDKIRLVFHVLRLEHGIHHKTPVKRGRIDAYGVDSRKLEHHHVHAQRIREIPERPARLEQHGAVGSPMNEKDRRCSFSDNRGVVNATPQGNSRIRLRIFTLHAVNV